MFEAKCIVRGTLETLFVEELMSFFFFRSNSVLTGIPVIFLLYCVSFEFSVNQY